MSSAGDELALAQPEHGMVQVTFALASPPTPFPLPYVQELSILPELSRTQRSWRFYPDIA